MDTSAAYYPDSGLSLAQVPNASDMPYLPGSEDGAEIKLLHRTNGGDYILNTSYAVTQGYSVDVLRKIASLGFRLDRTHLEEWLTLAQYEHDTSHDVKGVYQLTLDFSLRIKMRD